ncbi:MAG: hypothetical protein KatS3mg060_0198 [Dehalococcoidia bacterium]|jgi:hypothetical protein|nr:MAG: hypothetical protein KatS3mg060_0198 [Dehalococcoidia bacterium]
MYRWRRRGEGFVLEDFDEIRRWVEQHGGRPARLSGTSSGDDPGLIRIWFPGQLVGRLEPITWEQFFAKMAEKRLALRCWDGERGARPFARIVSRPSERPQHRETDTMRDIAGAEAVA